MDPMQAIRDTFFQECEEQLGELETGLLAMENGSGDEETVNAVFRAVHSIKGGAGAFKLDKLVKFAHVFETTLDKIRNGVLAASTPVMKSMLRAADVLADLVTFSREGGEFDDARSNELIAELNAHCEEKPAEAKVEEAPAEEPDNNPFAALGWEPVALAIEPDLNEYVINFKPKAELYSKGNETTRLLRELSRLGALNVHCETADIPLLANLEPEQSYLSWRAMLRTDQDIAAVQAVFEFVDTECHLDIEAVDLNREPPPEPEPEPEPQPEPAPAPVAQASAPAAEAKPAAEEIKAALDAVKAAAPPPREAAKPDVGVAAGNTTQNTIRVDLDRVDRLINLVGELVINQAMLTQRVLEAGAVKNASIATGLDDLEHLTREIQESVMAIRAQPVRPLFQRMSRIVREIADATGKNVRLKTEGEGAEVDRTVIERLADPLTHMIRNAVDHGLEKPDARVASGKPAQGEVRLSAAHKSGRVVIEVADDGKGIDRPRVKAIAIKKGLIPADALLTDTEIDNLLFMPGFSTAEVVSNISGRGVGMDVVKRSIQALGGRISITSKPGQGSTFSMSLPLTLAVLDGMVVKVADQTLVVPLNSILETMKPKGGEVYGLGPDSQVIGIRGGFTPLIDVGYELGFRMDRADPMQGVTLLIETEGGVRSALMVDAIQDQRQVVIKSLEANYGHVDGIAAATILGDGRIALILDTDAIVNASSGRITGSEMLLAG
jgi:two-component system chemotaxis sensor kinase CheA